MAKKRGGLGRGLESLFEDTAPSFESDNRIETLPLREIEPDPAQPRKTFDEETLAELAASISEHGLLQPIAVRPHGVDRYLIVAGERRWRACRMAGLTEAPVVVKDVTDEQAMELALVENLQREDLDPVEEALGIRELMTRCDLTQEQAARKLGKSRSALANSLRLLNLPETVLELLKGGFLTTGHAKVVLGLPTPELQEQAAQIIAELPRAVQLDVVERIAGLDRVSPEMIKLVEDSLEARFTNITSADQVEVGGVPYVAEIMNRVDRSTEKYIFDELGGRNAALADEIHKLMFTFEDIVNLDSMAIQRFIREVDTKDLAVALKSKDTKVKSMALPSALSACMGITEPAIFGVNLRYFKPFLGGLLGGACGAWYASIVGLGATGTGVTGIFGILLHLHMPLQYIIMMAISFGVSFAVTWVIWSPEEVKV